MRIVVLGANGQLGTPVLEQLLKDFPQAQVLGCVRAGSMTSVKGDTLFSQHLTPFNPFADDWTKLGRVDVLINCIGIIREKAELDFEQAHMGLTKLMLQHREQLGNPRIIQLSALGAELLNPSRFLSTKAQADALLLQHQDVVVVRPSIVCTPDTMLSRKLQMLKQLCRRTFGVLPFPERLLLTKLQPVMVEDLAELMSRLCQQNARSGIVEVGGGTIYSLAQLLALVPTCKRVVPIPQPLYKVLLLVITTLFPSLLDKDQQVLLEQDNIADINESEAILGRTMADTEAFWKRELQKSI